MREYQAVKQETESITKVFCNACGAEIPLVGEGLWADYFHGEKAWGYFSEQDGREDSFDICQSCYDKWTDSFAIKIK